MVQLRNKSDAVKFGKFEDITKGNGYFAYTRIQDDEKVLVVCNFDEPREIAGLPDGECALCNGTKRKPDGEYAPFEAAVFIVK